MSGGIGGLIVGIIAFAIQQMIQGKTAERLARVESQLSTQAQWMAARFTRVDERRARALARLHRLLDRALELTKQYIGSHAANNGDRLEKLHFACARCWMAFGSTFECAEIYLSEDLAGKVRIYSDAIGDIKINFGAREATPGSETPNTQLQVIDEALRQLGKLQAEVRPQLVHELRVALGTIGIDSKV